MKCPYCSKDDEVYEVGTIQVMYHITGTDKNGNLEYGDRTDFGDSFWPDDYPYHCKHCNKGFDYHKGKYYVEDVGELSEDNL